MTDQAELRAKAFVYGEQLAKEHFKQHGGHFPPDQFTDDNDAITQGYRSYVVAVRRRQA